MLGVTRKDLPSTIVLRRVCLIKTAPKATAYSAKCLVLGHDSKLTNHEAGISSLQIERSKKMRKSLTEILGILVSMLVVLTVVNVPTAQLRTQLLGRFWR